MLDLGIEIHACKDVLHIVRETIQIGLEVICDVLRVGDEGLECKRTGVVERVTGGFPKEAIFHGQFFYFLICIQHGQVRRQKAVMETFDDCHRKDGKAIFIGLIGSDQVICYRPDKAGSIICIFPTVKIFSLLSDIR